MARPGAVMNQVKEDMGYRLAADIVVVIHFAFIVFVVFGGLLVLKWRWVAAFHLPAAAWGAVVVLTGWICPLTPLENLLRAAAGSEDYSSGFIEHYIMPLIYPLGLTRNMQVILGWAVAAINLLIYAAVGIDVKRSSANSNQS